MESMTLKISPSCPSCNKVNDLWMSTYVVKKIANKGKVLHLCDACGTKLNISMSGSDFVFLYWDDLGDSQEHVDNQKNQFDYFKKHPSSAEYDEDEERMKIIVQNGNTGEHYKCNKCDAPLIDVLDGVYPCDSDNCPFDAGV
jgi:uncharacterized protein YlaI